MANRGSNNGSLIDGKDALTKGVLAIALTERTARCYCHTGEKPKRVLPKNGSEFLARLPKAFLMIAHDEDP